MGIHGIYKEIGPGERVALSKLAVEKFEEKGRPLRIAIDVSIWLFQIQASKGGTNPALRTFYYRLLRLISLSIHPIFVFDGPNKPPFKRNKRTGANVASVPEFLAKQLLGWFGFPIHRAPGEAEAECALLQREGIVDAVFSEDVDTLMFGSGLTIRNWSPEQKLSSKTPTHVNVYDAVKTKSGPSGLDHEGMILVALMSGGDYVPEGIPGCGPKTACEAARAGFGRDLCQIRKGDAVALQKWRARLEHELKTNESKMFTRKHGKLVIPEDFPRADILGYYTHPAISNQTALEKLRRSIKWDQDLDYSGLRGFTLDAFGWENLGGAKHFIRTLAPVLLVCHLRKRGERTSCAIDGTRSDSGGSDSDDLSAIQAEETKLVKGIHGKRQHIVTDHTTELRVSFTPLQIVDIDLDKEDPEEEVPDADDDELLELDIGDGDTATKKRGPTKFDPSKPVRVWVLETFVKVGVPLKVQDWEAALVKPKRAATAKEASKPAPRTKGAKRAITTGCMAKGAIMQYAKVTKPGAKLSQTLAKAQRKDTSVSVSQERNIPRSNSRDPPPATQPSCRAFIDLLSSSPPRPAAAPPSKSPKEKTISPLPELPPTVTKRRRGPMQRSHTLPADTSTLERPSTPPLLDPLEMLDLVSSPALPSPSQFPAKKARTRVPRNPAARVAQQTSMTSSPGTRTKQTTLDPWPRSSPAGTPIKDKAAPHLTSSAPMPAPLNLHSSPSEIETLDLTLSPPLEAPNPRRASPKPSSPRPPLRSISSNTSRSPSKSKPTASKPSRRTSPCRTSPRLRKPASPDIETLDLTHLSSPASPKPPKPTSTSPDIEILDLTQLSSPEPTPAPSMKPSNPPPSSSTSYKPSKTPPTNSPHSPPQTSQSQHQPHTKSPSPRQSPRKTRTSSSPPAPWKQREKKKRLIRLRNSVAGAWEFVDVDDYEFAADTATKSGKTPGDGVAVPKGKARRMWRVSQVEVLDLS
ncbi:hypothetical protein BCR34DRAFT_573196 [Clohesyomyces aquaticus]|uniref:XPG-I domain-containing protein n=1 Tax=Clohesyomyces aquaticus TaxID=1231657 RepID=A0A1Y1Z0U5_9PLEO|nr:hypothetical protein BCR34DRAFT_573196 [Clohesyomyces aquaticus]